MSNTKVDRLALLRASYERVYKKPAPKPIAKSNLKLANPYDAGVEGEDVEAIDESEIEIQDDLIKLYIGNLK